MAMEEFAIVQNSPISDKAINFADDYVKAACVAKFDQNGDGVLTYGEVSTVTDVSGLFDDLAKSKITSFDEFENFVAVTSLPSDFLYGAEKLTSVKLPESLTSINSNALSGCKSLESIVIPEGVTKSFYNFYDCIALKSVKLPSGATSLPSFRGCTSLESIDIPAGVTAIGEEYSSYGVFENCTSLKTVNIVTPVTAIGSSAFEGCSSLTSFDLSSVQHIGTGAFAGSGLTSITIPDAIQEIPANAFAGCEDLKTVKLHDNIVKIGNSAFGLYSVRLEDGYSYKYCSSLTEIDLPENLLAIEGRAFEGAALKGKTISGTDIVALEIPANVNSIASGAFVKCKSLAAIKMHPTSVPAAGSDMFPSETVIYVPEASVEAYKAARYWKDYMILADNMMTLSLSLDYSVGSGITFNSEERCFDIPMTVKLVGDNDILSSVKEYGFYIQREDNWGGGEQMRYPVTVLNENVSASVAFERHYFEINEQEFTAVADVTIGAYLILADDNVLTFDQSSDQIRYDVKPSVEFIGYEVVETVVEERESKAVIDLKFDIKGSFWIDNFMMESDGDGSWHLDRIHETDGLNLLRGEWQLWDEAGSSSQISIKCSYIVGSNWENPSLLDPITLKYSEIFK